MHDSSMLIFVRIFLRHMLNLVLHVQRGKRLTQTWSLTLGTATSSTLLLALMDSQPGDWC